MRSLEFVRIVKKVDDVHFELDGPAGTSPCDGLTAFECS